MNCTFAYASLEMIEGLEPAVLEYAKVAVSTWYSGPSIKCKIKTIHPTHYVGPANSSGWYPETSARGMLQRGKFDVLGMLSRFDTVDNPKAFFLEVPLESSQLIVASSQKMQKISRMNIFQSMNPFDPIVYIYMFFVCFFIAVVVTASDRIRKLIRRCKWKYFLRRRRMEVYILKLKDVRLFLQNLPRVISEIAVGKTDRKPSTNFLAEKFLWLSTWIVFFVLVHGYVDGLFATDLNFKIKPERVESLKDILDPKFEAIPVIYGQVAAMDDFVAAKPGSIEYRIYEKTQEKNSTIVINESAKFESILESVKMQLKDPRVVLIEYEFYLELMIRIFDAALFHTQIDSNQIKEDTGFMRKGKVSSHHVLFGAALRPNIESDKRGILNRHLRRFFEGGCPRKSWEDMKTGCLSRCTTSETPETRRRASLDYFDRLEKEEVMNPRLPPPFGFEFFRPLFIVYFFALILSFIVLVCEATFYEYQKLRK